MSFSFCYSRSRSLLSLKPAKRDVRLRYVVEGSDAGQMPSGQCWERQETVIVQRRWQSGGNSPFVALESLVETWPRG